MEPNLLFCDYIGVTLVFYKTKLQGLLSVQVNIPLGKGNDDPGLSEKVVDAKPHTALNESSFNDATDNNPEIDLEDQSIVSKIIKNHKIVLFIKIYSVFLNILKAASNIFLRLKN